MISSQSDDSTIKTAADYPIGDIAGIGCLQFFPIFFFLLLFVVILILSIFDTTTQSQLLNYENNSILLFIFISISLVGLAIGIFSSIIFFSAWNKKNISNLKRGILFNIISWVCFILALIFFHLISHTNPLL